MAGRVLGEAFVVISPAADQFLTELTAKVTAAIKAYKPPTVTVPVEADTRPAIGALGSLATYAKTLYATLGQLRADVSTTAGQAALARLQAQVLALAKQMSKLGTDIDVAGLAAFEAKLLGITAAAEKFNEAMSGAVSGPATEGLARLRTEAAALQGTLGNLRVEATDTGVRAKLAGLEVQAMKLRETLSDLEVSTNPVQMAELEAQLLGLRAAAEKFNAALSGPAMGPVNQELADLQDRVDRLAATLANVPMNGNDADLNAKIAAMLAVALKLRDSLKDISIGGDPVELASKTAEVMKLQAAFQKLGDTAAGPMFGPVTEQLAKLQSMAAMLSASLGNIPVKADDTATAIKLAGLQVQAMKLQETLKDLSVGGDPVKMAGLAVQLMGITAAAQKLVPVQSQLTAGGQLLANTLTALNNRLTITPSLFGKTMAGFSGLHLIIDGVIEVLIVAISSFAALAAGAAVAYPAVDQVAYNFMHLNQVMTIFSQDAGPMAKTNMLMDQFKQKAAPQVIEAYGGAMQLLGRNTEVFGNAGLQVVHMFDLWIARVNIWANGPSGQKTMNGILQSGIGFLGQLARIIGTVALAIDNLMTKDPGIAGMLLKVIGLVADAINWFSQWPAPIVEAILAIHGLYLWGSVLLGLLLKLAAPIIGVGKAIINLSAVLFDGAKAATGFVAALDFLFTTPAGALLLLAAAVGAVIYETNQATGSTKTFIAGLEQSLNQMTASEAASTGLAAGIGQIRSEMANTSGLLAEQQKHWGDLSHTFTSFGFDAKAAALNIGKGFKDILYSSNWSQGLQELGHGFWDTIVGHGGQSLAVADNIKHLNDELGKLQGSYHNLYGETGSLMKQGYSYQQALGLMDAAGVKWNDTQQQMATEVNNLINGYKYMGIQGGLLTNSVNALNFQTELQDSKVSQLNQAWDTFFQTISGGASSFNSFASQSIGLYQSLGDVSDRLTVSNGRTSIALSNTASAAANQTATMTGLNSASIQARDAFLQTASAANTQLDSLTTLSAAAALGAKGTGMLQQATKDMVLEMLPAAKGSQEMTSVLEALAEHGGFQPGGAANMFSQLAKWAGNTKDPMKSLDGITATLTQDAAGLTTDVKNLSVALGTTLTGAIDQAIFAASGGQKPIDNFANALMTTGANSKTTRDSAQRLADEFYHLNGNVQDTHDQFVTMIQQITGSRVVADQLWNEVKGNLTPSLGQLSGQLANTKTDFENFAGKDGGKGLGLTKKQTDELQTDLKDNLVQVLGDLANKDVPAAKTAFEQLAGKTGQGGMGLSKQQADELYKYLNGNMVPMLELLYGNKVPATQQAFEQLAGKTGQGGMGLAKQQADELWQYFNGNIVPLMELLYGGKIPTTQKAFEAWAGKGGAGGMNYTTQQADALYKKIKNDLIPTLDAIPPTKTTNVTMKGTGSFTIQDLTNQMNAAAQNAGRTTNPGSVAGRLQTGGRIPGWGGGDVVPAMLEPGETVLPKHATGDPLTRAVGAKYGVPGFQTGGIVGNPTVPASDAYSGNLSGAYINTMLTDFSNQFSNSMTGAMKSALKAAEQAALSGGTGTGADIVSYALSFLGKIPYVWGGTTLGPAGADCSGFTQSVFSHFGYKLPRTSEQQGAWVTQTKQPQYGGLAFFDSPAGGPPPGHVGIVIGPNSMVSQAGPPGVLGPTLGSLVGAMFTGVPPGGFATPGTAAGSTPGVMSQAAISSLWVAVGGPAGVAADMARIAYAESGGDPSIVQQGQPPGLTGWGLYQITPTSGIWQNGQFGNLLNATNNSLAALSLFRYTGFSPWASDPVGAQLTGGGPLTYAVGGISSRLGQPPVSTYDQGGTLPPGISIAYNGTGANETILPVPPEAIPGFATGGIITAYRSQLIGDQTAELKDYAAFVAAGRDALAHAKSGSYESTHRKSILDEMGTLAKRQASEATAYGNLRGGGLTISDLAKLITAINHEVTTSHDVALSHLPGRTLDLLRGTLTALAKLAASPPSLLGAVGPGAETLFPAWPTPSGTVPQQQFWTWLPAIEHDEKSQYAKTVAAFTASQRAAKVGQWNFTHRATIDKELQTLALRQNEQLSDYNAVMLRTGFPPKASDVKKLQNAVKSMAVTVQDADLSHVPGGHPALMSGIYRLLGQVYDLTGKGVGNPETPFPALFGTPALPKRGTQEYATLASIFGWYDRGGVLPPGLTLAYNGTGRNEVVSPVGPSGVYGPGGLTPGEMQLINRLDRLIAIMSAAPAAYSQALNGVAAQASSRGFYGGTG